ncbi:MAG: hypothetical protein V3T58_03890 [Candidatus Hydrothermarchaeales archaeon]
MIKKLAILSLFVIIVLTSISPITDYDLWWHLSTGRYILENREIPRIDVFSHTNYGTEWLDHEWLSEVIFFLSYEALGFKGLVLLKALAILIAFGFLYKRSSFFTSPFFNILLILAVIEMSKGAWLERPMIFTFALVSVYIYILDLYAKGIDKLWTLPILMLLWANLHGGFILGILLTGIYALTSKSRKLVYITGACTFASLFNPYTYKLLLYPIQYAYESIHAKFILEWRSPIFHQFSTYEAMLLLSIIALAKSKIKVSNRDLILLIIFTHLSLFATRNISLYALVCAPIIAKYTESTVRGYLDGVDIRVNRIFLRGFLYTFVILGTISFLYAYFTIGSALATSPQPNRFPENAVDFLLENNYSGNMYNVYHWGGYAILRLYPNYRVFIDGRADMYGDFIYEYLTVHRIEPKWREVLDKHEVSIVLIPIGEPLDVILLESRYWEETYRDEVAVVYIREVSLS